MRSLAHPASLPLLTCHFLQGCDRLGDGHKRLADFARTDAAGAHPHSPGGASDGGPYAVQVGIPAAFCNVVGVADVVSKTRPLAAYLTNPSHNVSSPDTKQNLSLYRIGAVRVNRIVALAWHHR